MLGNVRSVRNKVDELTASCKYNSEYRDSCLICLTETWLEPHDPEGILNIDGYCLIRGDRQGTSKSHGGGLCIFVNERWCKNITIKDTHCDDNIELLTISCRPYYLPREFNNIYITVAYVPPSGNYAQASESLVECVNDMDNNCPNGINLLMGDFNGCDIGPQIPHYRQYVECPTRGERTLDLLYCNIDNAYRIAKRPPLGISDHNMLYCMPSYVQKLKTELCKKIKIRQWSDENVECLKACFDCTDWQVLYDEGCELDYNVDVCSSYINFCTDLNIPVKVVTVFPNNKPWVSKEVKEIINEKKRALSNDRTALKTVQKKLREKICNAKRVYKDKIENLFKSRQAKDAWKGLRYLSGSVNKNCMPEPEDVPTYVDELNEFYSRFDVEDHQVECNSVLDLVEGRICDKIVMTEDDVLKALNTAKPGKASGPDKVCSRVIKACKYELTPPLHKLYQSSLDQCTVPSAWKTSEVVPVPKLKIPKTKNDLRPVALTSVLMKCLESFVRKYLCNEVKHLCDKFQFAYRANRSVDDAVVTLLDTICSHVDKPGNCTRVLFVDFSSAFNTIKPHVMLHKLYEMNVNTNVIKWIYSYLTMRPQYVKMQNTLSKLICTNTGAPQGCVLSPLLFTLYTNDCVSTCKGCIILKYADDTAIIGNITNNVTSLYMEQIEIFVKWCDTNFLNLNVRKTKEMIIDFRNIKGVNVETKIKGEKVDVVNCYKYLGVLVDDSLKFGDNVHNTYKKCCQRIRYLRGLAEIRIDRGILSMFYKSIIESVLSFCIVAWYGSSNKLDLKKLHKIVRIARKMGVEAKSLQELYNDKILKLARKIMKDKEHLLNKQFSYLKSGRRLTVPRQRTTRYANTFVPSAIRYFNWINSK